MDHPAAFIERYRQWSYQMRDAFQSLSSENDYRYWFDPFWIRAQPYRVSLRPGETKEIALYVRNFRSRQQTHQIEIHVPPGLTAEPTVLMGTLDREARTSFAFHIKAARDAQTGVSLVAFDVTLDGQRYGERFDLIVGVE
jgi:hypothetical protein